jgi:hypothetical protein
MFFIIITIIINVISVIIIISIIIIFSIIISIIISIIVIYLSVPDLLHAHGGAVAMHVQCGRKDKLYYCKCYYYYSISISIIISIIISISVIYLSVPDLLRAHGSAVAMHGQCGRKDKPYCY